MPKQVIRLFIAFVIFVGLFMLAKYLLIPASFGDLGHYRADAIDDIKKIEAKYTDTLSCASCHKDVDSVKTYGAHSGINCQACHGPGAKHAANPKTDTLGKPSAREFCGKCHDKNASRPAFVKQVDITKHNTGKKCITCHNPHSPGFNFASADKKDTTGTTTGDSKTIDDATCGKCHSAQYTKKQSGVHKSKTCTSCHGQGDKHVENPTANVMTKPKGRVYCGTCHGTGSTSSGIKQINLQEHNVDDDCVDCHDPHSPLDF